LFLFDPIEVPNLKVSLIFELLDIAFNLLHPMLELLPKLRSFRVNFMDVLLYILLFQLLILFVYFILEIDVFLHRAYTGVAQDSFGTHRHQRVGRVYLVPFF
jgi:hypothetical protein